MNNLPLTQYQILVKDRYQAIPLNTNYPVGHHKVTTFTKTCLFDIKKSNK